MRLLVAALLFAALGIAAESNPAESPKTPPGPVVTGLLQVKRVYVEALAGNETAEAIRQLIIATLEQTRLFVLTDNPDRADVTLKGAANDTAFTDTFDSFDGASGHANAGLSTGKITSTRAASGGLFGGITGSDNNSEHIRERKHEAYATVRLCNRDGDVLWATTQESRGAKFHNASTDVAEKITRQLQFDFAKAIRESNGAAGAIAPVAPGATAPLAK